jgi:hypothetical protein
MSTTEYPKQLNEDWIILFDKKTKKEYYANVKAKLTQWTLPDLKPKEEIESSIQTAVGNTAASSPFKEKEKEQEFVAVPVPVTQKRKPVTYLHSSDPFSLKLLIWLKETNYLDYTEIKTVNDMNQAAIHEECQQELSYPTTIFPSGEVISGADHNIHTFLSQYPPPSPNSINWDSLTVFNFYSCGLLLEHGNRLHDHDSNSHTTRPGTSTGTGSINGVSYSEEYLSLHEENIRLQLYLSGNQIQQFRSEQSYRNENQRLRDEIEKLSSRLIELTHKLSVERTAIYNKILENKTLQEGNLKLEEEKKGLVHIMTTQSKVHHEELHKERIETGQWGELFKELNGVLGVQDQEKEALVGEKKEGYLARVKEKLAEDRHLVQSKDKELESLKESIRYNPSSLW